VALAEGDTETASRYLSRALADARAAGFAEGVAKALLATGILLRRSGDMGRNAHLTLQEALEADYSDWNADFRCRVLLNLVMVHVRKGEPDQALESLDRARVAAEQGGRPILQAWGLKYEGFVRLLQRLFEGAAERFQQAGVAFRRFGNSEEAARCEELHLYATAPSLFASIQGAEDAASPIPRYLWVLFLGSYFFLIFGSFFHFFSPASLTITLVLVCCLLIVFARRREDYRRWRRRNRLHRERTRLLERVNKLEQTVNAQTGLPEEPIVQQFAVDVQEIRELVQELERLLDPAGPGALLR
jgi:hypothetical protein